MSPRIVFITTVILITVLVLKADESTPEMVKIPAGKYTDAADDAIPLHKVTLNAFLMDKYEVTQEDYKKLIGKNPSATRKRIALTKELKKLANLNLSFSPVGNTYPVIDITWYEAVKYCNARSKSEGLEPCYDEKTWKCDFTRNGYRGLTESHLRY